MKLESQHVDWERFVALDSGLSAAAAGVWYYLYKTGLPVSEEVILDRFDMGRTKYLRIMRELRESGLVVLETLRSDLGRIRGRALKLNLDPESVFGGQA
jgi:hypothetical protein